MSSATCYGECCSVPSVEEGTSSTLDMLQKVRASGSFFIEESTFFNNGKQLPVGQDLLIIEASRSHSDTPHSVGLIWTSDQPDAEIFI